MGLPDISGMDALIKIGNIQGSSTGIGSTGQGGGAGNNENTGTNAPLIGGSSA